jgi:hypothetical protein
MLCEVDAESGGNGGSDEGPETVCAGADSSRSSDHSAVIRVVDGVDRTWNNGEVGVIGVASAMTWETQDVVGKGETSSALDWRGSWWWGRGALVASDPAFSTDWQVQGKTPPTGGELQTAEGVVVLARAETMVLNRGMHERETSNVLTLFEDDVLDGNGLAVSAGAENEGVTLGGEDGSTGQGVVVGYVGGEGVLVVDRGRRVGGGGDDGELGGGTGEASVV